MKSFSMILIALFALVAPNGVVFADNVGPVKTRPQPIERFGEAAPIDATTEIRGHCFLVQGTDAPITTPCSNVVVKLQDRGDKTTEIEARTDQTGAFAFAVTKEHWYVVRAGSKSFSVIGPKRMLKGGDNIELKLRQH